MRDTTAKVGMTPTSKNSMAASAAAMKTSGRQFEMPKIELPANLREGNVIAAFDFAQNLATAKSVPDVIEYSRAHARIQFDALAAQTKELTDLARNVATEMAEPINASIANAGEKAA
jgi:hypothetical protein